MIIYFDLEIFVSPYSLDQNNWLVNFPNFDLLPVQAFSYDPNWIFKKYFYLLSREETRHIIYQQKFHEKHQEQKSTKYVRNEKVKSGVNRAAQHYESRQNFNLFVKIVPEF